MRRSDDILLAESQVLNILTGQAGIGSLDTFALGPNQLFQLVTVGDTKCLHFLLFKRVGGA